MTANAMLGFIGTLIGGAACFCLGFYCALKWVAAELDPGLQGTTHLVRRTMDGVVGGQNSEEK